MTSTLATPTRPSEPLAGDQWNLARFEGRKLLRHPLFLAFAAVSLLFTFVFFAETTADSTGTWYTLLAAGPVQFIPFAAGVMVAANMATSRSRHDDTDELYSSMPLGAASRLTANLASVGWAVVLAVVLVAIGFVVSQAWTGLPVAMDTSPAADSVDYLPGSIEPTDVSPSLAELTQVPLAVGVFGLVGVALAVWVRTRLVLLLLPVLVLAHVTVIAWGIEGAWRWFLPFTNSEQAVGWIQTSDDGTGYSVVQGYNVGAMGWHGLYLVGVGALLSALALARYRRDGRVLALLVVGVVAAGLGGVMQVAAYTPSL